MADEGTYLSAPTAAVVAHAIIHLALGHKGAEPFILPWALSFSPSVERAMSLI